MENSAHGIPSRAESERDSGRSARLQCRELVGFSLTSAALGELAARQFGCVRRCGSKLGEALGILMATRCFSALPSRARRQCSQLGSADEAAARKNWRFRFSRSNGRPTGWDLFRPCSRRATYGRAVMEEISGVVVFLARQFQGWAIAAVAPDFSVVDGLIFLATVLHRWQDPEMLLRPVKLHGASWTKAERSHEHRMSRLFSSRWDPAARC